MPFSPHESNFCQHTRDVSDDAASGLILLDKAPVRT